MSTADARFAVHLIDGTYELFRHFHALPTAHDANGMDVAAVRGVLRSILGMIKGGATHLGVATDHIIESFRNKMWPGYKTGQGIDPALLAQFPLLEEVLAAAGVMVWPMVEWEADDALASAAALAERDPRVLQVIICTPDKDLAQCVRGNRVVQLDRRKGKTLDEAAILAKYGVAPRLIPEYLALVGDSADGYPGIPGSGAKSSANGLNSFGSIEKLPRDSLLLPRTGAAKSLALSLQANYANALLFRDLATLRIDIPLFSDVDELCWNGPGPEFEALAKRLDSAVTVKLNQSA